MDAILNILEEQKNWKQFIKKACRRNKINVEIASFFTPNKVKAVHDRFLKNYEMKTQQDRTCWLENQLKAFYWFLAVLSGLRELLILNFGQQEWATMNQIFMNKDESIMEYESIKLVNQRANKNRSWSQEETQMLTEIIKQNQNSNKWNDIARKLFQRSEQKFFRSGKQCRERWLNHLDPNKKRGQWQEQEDKMIVKYILTYGRRWSNIAKELGNHRTEHMVKNRFKTLIIRQKKITTKVSNQNTLLREIGKRIIGQDALPYKKSTFVKQEDEQEQEIRESNSISEQQINNDEKQQAKQQNSLTKKTDILIPFPQTKGINQQKMQKQQVRGPFQMFGQNHLFRDPIISQVIQDCSMVGTVSTPLSNYQLQQIYSPFYLNYKGITPYLSPTPALPFFMNSSFSTFDNSFNQNLFIRPNNNHILPEKKDFNE